MPIVEGSDCPLTDLPCGFAGDAHSLKFKWSRQGNVVACWCPECSALEPWVVGMGADPQEAYKDYWQKAMKEV